MKQIEISEEKILKLKRATNDDKINEWLGNLQWVLRTVKKTVYDTSQEFVDYLLVSYDVLPIFTTLYKITQGHPSKSSTYHCGSFMPSDNNYEIDIYVSLDLEPGTIGIGVSSRCTGDTVESGNELFNECERGIEYVCKLVGTPDAVTETEDDNN